VSRLITEVTNRLRKVLRSHTHKTAQHTTAVRTESSPEIFQSGGLTF